MLASNLCILLRYIPYPAYHIQGKYFIISIDYSFHRHIIITFFFFQSFLISILFFCGIITKKILLYYVNDEHLVFFFFFFFLVFAIIFTGLLGNYNQERKSLTVNCFVTDIYLLIANYLKQWYQQICTVQFVM